MTHRTQDTRNPEAYAESPHGLTYRHVSSRAGSAERWHESMDTLHGMLNGAAGDANTWGSGFALQNYRHGQIARAVRDLIVLSAEQGQPESVY